MRSIEEYKRLPYTWRASLVEEEDGAYFVAFIEEIPWIRTYGDTREEAYYELHQSFEDALLAMIEAGDEIPEPVGAPGKWGAPHEGPPHPRRWSPRDRQEPTYTPPEIRGIEDAGPFTRVPEMADT